MFRLICCALFFSCAVFAVDRGQEIPLWPAQAENPPDVFQPSDNPKLPKKFTVVHHPSIYIFLPPKETANGLAVVVAPGGGHSQLVIDKEGWEIAGWLNKNGIAAFVLKYRLARAADSHYTVERDALADAAQAMRMVRSHAAEWGVDPKKIGFMGFSAGGEVAALIETRFDGASSRPDFAVVVYPGFKPGTITVPKDAPPTFLVCADDDTSHVVTTVNLYLDLQKQGVSSELHIYASGKHGFGMRPSNLPVATWPDRLREWMVDRKLLAP
jgi:acetyl esterase/lipase